MQGKKLNNKLRRVKMAEIARMRTRDGIYNELHKMDPGSQISKHFIYQLMVQGKVRTVFAGNKRLANLDEVLQYLQNPPSESETDKNSSYGQLRRIE